MSNPTIGNDAQFTNPFNILPDLKPGSNPILEATAQFSNPYDILPNPSLIKFNPTIGNIDPTQDFDILPNSSLGRLNPTRQQQYQFTTPLQMGGLDTFDILPNPIGTQNPTIGETSIRNPGTPGPLQMGSFTTYDIVDFPNPNIALQTPFTKSPILYIPGEALPIQYFTNWYYNPIKNAQFRFNFNGRSLGSNILSIGSAVNAQFGLTQNLSFTPNFTSTIGGGQFSTPYAALNMSQLTTNFIRNTIQDVRLGFSRYVDFRSRLKGTKRKKNRNDGEAIADISTKAERYAEAAQSKAGAYSVFNLNAPGKDGYGWGEHDAPGADRSDFTARTNVATKWDNEKKEWASITLGLKKKKLEKISPFRGDKVNVIDFRKDQKLTQAYEWKPESTSTVGSKKETKQEALITKDFIKFYFTGPKLQNGLTDATDDILVFRAAITNLADSFNANWTPVPLIGRADPNYHYTGYSRDLSLAFDVYATTRDELKFIWRKLNALAGYTAPEYRPENIALIAPWMRITIGDLFVQQPVVLNSLNFDYSTDDSWEINIEDDPENMQVPFKISVTTQFNMIMDHIPQKGGRFFTLAKKFDPIAKPLTGNDNWLSDAKDNSKIARAFSTGEGGQIEIIP